MKTRLVTLALLVALVPAPLLAQESPSQTSLSRTDEDGQPGALPAPPAGMSIGHLRSGDAVFRGKGGCVACHGRDATGVPGKGSSLTAGLNYIPKPYSWAGLDSLERHGISEAISRTNVACPPRGAQGNLTDAEVSRVAAYVWAIAQVRGEPWPGGHPTH